MRSIRILIKEEETNQGIAAAGKVAWGAVKTKYKKDKNGNWHKR